MVPNVLNKASGCLMSVEVHGWAMMGFTQRLLSHIGAWVTCRTGSGGRRWIGSVSWRGQWRTEGGMSSGALGTLTCLVGSREGGSG